MENNIRSVLEGRWLKDGKTFMQKKVLNSELINIFVIRVYQSTKFQRGCNKKAIHS